MTDVELATALKHTIDLEAGARTVWQHARADDLVERDNALIVIRHATAMRKSIERWIGIRAVNGSTIGSS